MRLINANVAQLVEQLTRNEQVSGSSPLIGSGCSRALVVGGYGFHLRFVTGVSIARYKWHPSTALLSLCA